MTEILSNIWLIKLLQKFTYISSHFLITGFFFFCAYVLADRLVILSSLPVAHLSDATRGRLVVTGDSARIQDETTENSAWFFNVLGV